MTTDAELLRRYVDENSQAAFTELVERHIKLVYGTAVRLVGDPHRAKDVTQLVFTSLAQKARPLCHSAVLAGWLHTSTRYAAANLKRSELRRTHHEQEAATMDTFSRPDLTRTDWERLRPLIDDVIGELGTHDRDAVLLRYFDGLSFAEIGASLKVSEDAARMRVDRALDKLRRLLADRDVTSTAAALGAVLTQHAAVAVPAALSGSIAAAALASAGAGHAAVSGLAVAASGKFLAAAAVLAVAVVGTVVYAVNSRSASVASPRASASVAVPKSHAAVTASVAPPAVGRPTTADASRAPLGTATSAPEVEVNGPFGPNPPGSRARGRALLAAHPEIKRLLIEEKREYFNPRYRELYDDLGLTDAEIEAFELILIAGVTSTYGDGDRTVTLDPVPPLTSAEKDQRMRELLGEARFEKYRQFRPGNDRRSVQLASALYFTDTPLTAEQGARFERVLTECAPAFRDRPVEYWDAVRAKAADFLSPPQLAATRGLQAQDQLTAARIQNQKLRDKPGAAGQAANSQLEWMQDPAVQVLVFAMERAQLPETYGPFFRSESLTPEQVEKLSDALIRSRSNAFDVSEVKRTRGTSFDDPALVDVRRRNEDEIRAEMVGILGEAGYARLQDYGRTREIRTLVGKFAGAAAMKGVPLTPEQSESLAQTFARHSALYARGGPAQVRDIRWPEAEAEASRILSARQLQLLRSSNGAPTVRRSTALNDAVYRVMQEPPAPSPAHGAATR